MMGGVFLVRFHTNRERLDASGVLQIFHWTWSILFNRGRHGTRKSCAAPNVSNNLFALQLDRVYGGVERLVVNQHRWRQTENLRKVRRQAVGHPLEPQIIGVNTVHQAVETVWTEQRQAFHQRQQTITLGNPLLHHLANMPPHLIEPLRLACRPDRRDHNNRALTMLFTNRFEEWLIDLPQGFDRLL